MNLSKMSKGLLLGVALLLATSVFAANKGSLQVYDSVTVNGKQISPGDYSVQWEGSGPDVQVSILKGHKLVATAPAHVVNSERSADRDSAILKTGSNGEKELAEIRFGGKKFALALGESADKSDMNSTR